MMRWLRATIVVTLVSISTLLASAPAGIELVATGGIPGNGADLSGLKGKICSSVTPASCVPNNISGGFGSGLAYTGHDNVFLSAPDRGPFDGLTDVPYLDRVHFLHITTDLATHTINTLLLDTRLLKNEFGQNFVGAAGAFDTANEFSTLRLDPEGIRASAVGTFYVSDEYGPYIFEFDRQAHLTRRIEVPEKFGIANPSADVNTELLGNTSGRQANRGMEGLAITPDGGTLFGIMQSALLQDHGLNKHCPTPPGACDPRGRLSLNNRILKLDLTTGETHEYVYVLEAINRGQGVSEILAINDHQFLVLERDNRSYLLGDPNSPPTRKKIWKIDITGATDVKGVASLPTTLAASITPVTKTPFIDMLDPDFGLNLNNANAIAEKIEGLAWGPDLPDGRHLLYVMSDNDLIPNRPTQIFAFAIDETLLQAPRGPLNFQPQVVPGPLYPPGQVEKALRQK